MLKKRARIIHEIKNFTQIRIRLNNLTKVWFICWGTSYKVNKIMLTITYVGFLQQNSLIFRKNYLKALNCDIIVRPNFFYSE